MNKYFLLAEGNKGKNINNDLVLYYKYNDIWHYCYTSNQIEFNMSLFQDPLNDKSAGNRPILIEFYE